MIHRLLSKETMNRFLTDFKNRTDYVRKDDGKPFLSPNEAALVMDAINAWEIWRQQQFALTFYDRSRLHMESRTISTSSITWA